MADGYVLSEHLIDEAVVVYCVVAESSQRDFLDKWMANKQEQESLENFKAVVTRIAQHGITKMSNSTKVRCIDGNLDLYEIRNYFSTDRVMAVIRGEMVLLLRYEAHRGGNKKNSSKVMKRTMKLAKIAQELLEEEFGGKDGN